MGKKEIDETEAPTMITMLCPNCNDYNNVRRMIVTLGRITLQCSICKTCINLKQQAFGGEKYD